ncbi:crotonase/enoyl-CoA hydratase family protein [Paraglaciecola sp. MB-3u-78]|jgi:enoyl-CoA hydratase|uniref:crotonase/enoyl-CoA hydratase family protein n=1 Tax=Paraglaciecola sp. MB-3u-78 TaxID=2058332 RepID=UPI000C334933|nr:crotonase/enoyl-CoA hydratase family protein [Paraglaciecola sp. MB-3u-78]PKH00072.1 enoyl-CoA hydratase [Paraglaciecola sp. MB-3u-78]
MSELVTCQIENQVATITIQNGKVNAISHQVVDELNQALDQAEQAQAVVVLTGQAGMFSGGYDLKIMKESMSAAMDLVEKGSKLARRMLAFPYPVLAACNGHAVAKGAFLLLAADYRVGVDGAFKIGLNEVAIGMTMHYGGVELARGRLAPVFFNRSVILAEMVSPQAAVTAGFLDKVVSEAEFAPTVLAIAQAMTKLDMQAHHQTKLKARAELLQVLDQCIEKDRHSSL